MKRPLLFVVSTGIVLGALFLFSVAGALFISWQEQQNRQEIDAYLEGYRPDAAFGYSEFVEYAENPTTKNIARAAELIMLATVVDEMPATVDAQGFITHDVVLRSEKVYKGNRKAGDEIVVQVPSGAVGDGVRWSPHSPTYNHGEQAIAFLGFFQDTYYTAYDAYGVVHISRGKVTGISREKGVYTTSLATFEKQLARLLSQ